MEKIDILRCIQEHGMKSKDVAEKLNITTVALSQKTNGNPRLSSLREIADILGCNVRDFFYEVDEDGNYEDRGVEELPLFASAAEEEKDMPGDERTETVYALAECPHCKRKVRVAVVITED